MKHAKNGQKPVGSDPNTRNYEARDFREVARLVSRFFSFHRELLGYPPMAIEEAEQALNEDMLSPNSSILVYERNRRILGLARYELHEGAYFGRELMVDQHHRRQGIGKLLLNEAERAIREKGHELYISIVPRNEAAIHFFVSAGYDILNTIELRKSLAKESADRRPIHVLNVDLIY